MSAQVTFQDYRESLSYRVESSILEYGFGITDFDKIDRPAQPGEHVYCGILYKDPSISDEVRTTKGWFGSETKETIPARRWHLGFLKVKDGIWIFVLLGREYRTVIEDLLNKLAVEYEANITLRLVKEAPETESFYVPFVCSY
jgi:hypothetical protein